MLAEAEEAAIVAFRRHTLLPLDDCLYARQPSIPHLTRSALHRCLQRHGISRLPDVEGDKPQRQKFKRYPIGVFHIHCPAGDLHGRSAERGHCRGSNGRGQALHARRHRSDVQVRRAAATRISISVVRSYGLINESGSMPKSLVSDSIWASTLTRNNTSVRSQHQWIAQLHFLT